MKSRETVLQCFVTYPSRKTADKAMKSLLDRRLIACGQLFGPITSRYRWKGRIESSREWLVLAKTTERNWSAFEESVRSGHPYDVPEIVAVRVAKGLPDYLDWVTGNTRSER
jgi:periplasmic divalent cation tolerance protein